MKKFAIALALLSIVLIGCQPAAPVADQSDSQSKSVIGSVQVVAEPVTEDVTGSVQVVPAKDDSAVTTDSSKSEVVQPEVVVPEVVIPEVKVPEIVIPEVPAAPAE